MISIRSLRSLRAIRVSPLTSVRFYSIDEFNKNKKNYSFGLDLDNLSKQHLSKDDKLDLNSTLESHPDLVGLDQNSPEYKDTLYALHQSQQLNARAEQKRYESRERMKAVFYGFSAMIGIVAVHQLFMNYEYFKNWLTHESTYGKELDSKVKSLDDPSMNENNMNNLISRYTDDLDNANVINSLQGLSVPGLYLFGGNDNKKSKFPLRIPFFNDKILRDVQLKGDLLVAVSEKGNDLFELIINQKQNKQGAVATTKLPFRVTKAQISGDYVYLLSERGDLYYKVRSDRGDALFSGYQYRNYLGISRTSSTFGHIKISSKLADLKAGESHLLLLAKDGKLFVSSTSSSSSNSGQYGLPMFSPFSSTTPPINTAFELTNLNYELISAPDGSKSTRQRVFTQIASGDFHNLAADESGNVWTWGKNTYGECAQEISYKTDVTMPRVALSIPDYIASTKVLTKDAAPFPSVWHVEGLYAAKETSYVKVNSKSQADSSDYLMSFGNGLKGQLGVSVYYHVCPKPQIIKSLNGLSEYDETNNKVVTVGIKDIEIGGEHGFIVLNNSGDSKDVLCFGDNEFGQLGNGKYVKNSKPGQMPKLIEPEELKQGNKKLKKKLTKRLLDVNNQRFQLVSNKNWQQEIAAGDTSSAIYYKSNK